MKRMIRALSDTSLGIVVFRYFLFGAGLISIVISFAPGSTFRYPPPILLLGYSAWAVTGLLGISVAKVLKKIEARLQALERGDRITAR